MEWRTCSRRQLHIRCILSKTVPWACWHPVEFQERSILWLQTNLIITEGSNRHANIPLSFQTDIIRKPSNLILKLMVSNRHLINQLPVRHNELFIRNRQVSLETVKAIHVSLIHKGLKIVSERIFVKIKQFRPSRKSCRCDALPGEHRWALMF
jgi:hypothetical protein